MATRGSELIADDTLTESVNKDVFSTYVCRSLQRGRPHPGDIAEPSSLSAIPLPPCTYPLWDSLQDRIVETGKLSQLQLEGIMYACNKFQEMLPSGERAGFFVGDGAGVGKGRQIAGVILDSYARGRRQHIWLSTSSDLQLDAQRDLSDLGCHINVINNCQTLDREHKALGLSKDFKEGVLFMTYSTLVSQARGKSRMEQVIEWVGGPNFEGCLVFDECHKAKNFVPGKEGQSTKVSAAVIEIQQRLPRARVLYCSATGVSEVGNMAYMTRMGLWGPATAFQGFQEFLDTMKRRGVSFMEMLAMEMKAEGKYVARGLSFKNAEFMEMEAKLTAQQIEMYDAAVVVWQELRLKLDLAMEMCGVPRGDVQKVFWSAQQRFFKLLCVSLKVPMVVQEAKAALAAGNCVVIGLQSTGEAAVEAMGLEPGHQPGFMSATKELLARLILNYFPTKPPMIEGAPDHLQPKELPICLQMKEEILSTVDALQLPPNFLDQLVDLLGGPSNVAEMTGRRGRIVRDARGRHLFELRAKPDSNDMDSLNVREKDEFNKGFKLVAIISDAASTGISLHASKTAANQRRRVHLTIELPWSADKAIQQLGRSHRSNQKTAPIYKLVSTQVGGEKRFAAAVARRLQSLGALTRGDRRAASGIDLSEQNFDTPLGRKSLRRMYNHVVLESQHLPSGVTLADVYKDSDEQIKEEVAALTDPLMVMEHVRHMHAGMRDCCDMMGIGLSAPRNDTVVEDKLKEPTKEVGDVRRFLNRILGLPLARQNLLFNYFAATLSSEIRSAKAEGRYSEGVGDLFGSNITLAGRPETLWVDPHNPALKTTRYNFIIDRGVTFEDAIRRLKHEAMPGDDSGFRRSRRPLFNRHLVVLALQKPGQKSTFTAVRPNTGDSYFDMDRTELDQKYVRVKPEDVQAEWQEMYELTHHSCMHGRACQQGPGCQVGRRQTEVTILAGSVVLVWGTLEMVLERNERGLSRAERMLRVVRVPLDSDRYLVGVRYPAVLVPEVVVMLQSMQLMTLAGGQLQASGKPLEQVQREPPTPVCQKSLTKAFRPPLTVMDFFKRKASASAPASTSSTPSTTPSTGPFATPSTTRSASAPLVSSTNPKSKSQPFNNPKPSGNPNNANKKAGAAGVGSRGGNDAWSFTQQGKAAGLKPGMKRERDVELVIIEDSVDIRPGGVKQEGVKRHRMDVTDNGNSQPSSSHTPPTCSMTQPSFGLTKSAPPIPLPSAFTPPRAHHRPPILAAHVKAEVALELQQSSTPIPAHSAHPCRAVSPGSTESARTSAMAVDPGLSLGCAPSTPLTGEQAGMALENGAAQHAQQQGEKHGKNTAGEPRPPLGDTGSKGEQLNLRSELAAGEQGKCAHSLPAGAVLQAGEGNTVSGNGTTATEKGIVEAAIRHNSGASTLGGKASPYFAKQLGEDTKPSSQHSVEDAKRGSRPGLAAQGGVDSCDRSSDTAQASPILSNGAAALGVHTAKRGIGNGLQQGVSEREAGLALLVNMGFTSKQADKALLLTRSNVQQAIELLLAGMA